MALSLLLRNSARTRVLPALLKTSSGSTFLLNPTLNSRKTFTQIAKQVSKNVVASSKSQINFVIARRGMSGDHSKLWPIEKAVSIALLGVVPATLLFSNLVLDNIFALLVVAHFHWGLEACAVDYIRPVIFGPVIPKLAIGLLYAISALTLGSLLYYNHTCIGIGCTFNTLWSIKN